MWRRGTDLATSKYTVPVLGFARPCHSRSPSACILFVVLCGLVALWNVLRESMLTGTLECLFGGNCASESPAGVQNSHLKFYVA